MSGPERIRNDVFFVVLRVMAGESGGGGRLTVFSGTKHGILAVCAIVNRDFVEPLSKLAQHISCDLYCVASS